MHDDLELSQLLGSQIVRRDTLHEWPNSCVQKITLNNNEVIIYKYQSGGITESLFYETVQSSILPKAETLWRDDFFSCMVIEFIKNPPLEITNKSNDELLKISAELSEVIQNIEGSVPIILDISSFEKWAKIATETIASLETFINNKKHNKYNLKDINFIEKKVLSKDIQMIFNGKIGLIHGDLNGGNIFMTDEGYKLIDWQSCKKAPLELDRASFISRQGRDPAKLLNPEIAYMLYFVNIWWLVHCQSSILKGENYDDSIRYNISKIKMI